jgi:hypothetical protein
MQVVVTINAVEEKFAGGTVGGDWRIEMALASDPGAVVHSYEGVNPSTSFDVAESSPPDTYIVKGMRLDAGGSIIGKIATTQYTVGEDLVPIDVAGSISVSTPVVAPVAGRGGSRR